MENRKRDGPIFAFVLPNAKTPIELVSALLYFLAKYTTDIGSLQLKQWPNLNTYYLLTLGIATHPSDLSVVNVRYRGAWEVGGGMMN